MAREDELVGGPAYRPNLTADRGVIDRAPTNASDGLTVTLENYSTTVPYEVEAGQWVGRVTGLPPAGAPCLVIFDDERDAWVPVIVY